MAESPGSPIAPALALYFALAPGVDAIAIGDDSLLFRSDTIAVRVEGRLAIALRDEILPLLDGEHTLAQVAEQLPRYAAADLVQHLLELAERQALQTARVPRSALSAQDQAAAPLYAMLHAFGIAAEEARQALQARRVAVVGLEAQGAYIAALLAQCGVGELLLLDPFPCEPQNLSIMPPVARSSVGRPRQEVVRDMLLQHYPGGKYAIGGPQVSRTTLAAAVQGSHMIVGAFDKAFSAAHQWLNRASLAQEIPAIYSELKGHVALLGPMVVPRQTGCYMCYRMRTIACAENFEEAMRYEEHLDARKLPALHTRGVLPTLPPYAAGIVVFEILKRFLAIGEATLAGKVLEFNTLTLESALHPVLREPSCPICGDVKKNELKTLPALDELTRRDSPAGDLAASGPLLVSPRVGLVRTVHRVQKDVTEPLQPYVVRAELANHLFEADADRRSRTCSGKGFSVETARLSALGEAVERYSGSFRSSHTILYGERRGLPGEALDPHALVLYAADQYAQLPYAAYRDSSILGWVEARSLVTGRLQYVPALAVFMNYPVHAPDEYLFPVTSNGLAAGPTLGAAVAAAALEVIERDAFMITWLARLEACRLRWENHPDRELVAMCQAYRRRKVEVQLYRLHTDLNCHVFAAIAVEREPLTPKVVVGLGADLAAHLAARKAILEVGQVRPSLRQRCRQAEMKTRMAALVADPHQVQDLEDHDLLYAAPEAYAAFAFLTDQAPQLYDWDETPPSAPGTAPMAAEDKLARLVADLADKGHDLLYVDLTPSDLGALHLYTARVVIPGFQPIDFGWRERRLGGTRLYQLPQQLGLASQPLARSDLNDDPHPLA